VEYKILFSDDALRDFEQVLEVIRAHKPLAAEGFGDALLHHIDLLSAFPYHADRKLVEVLHLWHGSRRSPR
jgi:plasmid stabilization system protein ParE